MESAAGPDMEFSDAPRISRSARRRPQPRFEKTRHVRAIESISATEPWALNPLDAITNSESLHSAAAKLHIHQSTLQKRRVYLERQLGWQLREPMGRLRLAGALMVPRILRSHQGYGFETLRAVSAMPSNPSLCRGLDLKNGPLYAQAMKKC